MSEKESEEQIKQQAVECYQKRLKENGCNVGYNNSTYNDGFCDGYNKANEGHSPDEHIDKDEVVRRKVWFARL